MQEKPTEVKEKKPKVETDIIEDISKLVITKTIEDEFAKTIKSDWKNNLVRLIINEKCELENIYAVLESEKPEKNDLRKVIVGIANELLKALEKMIMQKRVSSYRSISTGIRSMKQTGEAKGKSKTVKKKKKDEDKKIEIKKTSLKDIGKELAEMEEQERGLEAAREKEQQTIQEERDKFSKAYQKAFDLYAYHIFLTAKGEEDIESFMKNIKDLGSSNFTDRQLALDKLMGDKKIKLCYDAFSAALKDKNISLKVIQAYGNMGDFRIVPTLINLMKENYQSSNSLKRGEAVYSIGRIVSTLNKESKNKGSILMLKLLKKDKMENTVEFLVPVVSKDIDDKKMTDDYYSKQCLIWLKMMAKKVGESKKKKVEVPLIGKNVFLSSPLSKQIKELEKKLEASL